MQNDVVLALAGWALELLAKVAYHQAVHAPTDQAVSQPIRLSQLVRVQEQTGVVIPVPQAKQPLPVPSLSDRLAHTLAMFAERLETPIEVRLVISTPT